MSEQITSNGDQKQGFSRALGLFDATTLVVGTIIGSGIFIVSADIARIVKSPGLMLIVWVIAGLLTIFAALSYAELAAAMPRAGGQYVFLREAFGRLPAFLYGWTFFLVISTGTAAAVAVAFAKFLGIFLPSVSQNNIFLDLGLVKFSTQQLTAMAIVIVLTIANTRGVRDGAIIQNIFTVLKTLALIMLLIAGLTIGRNSEIVHLNFTNMFPSSLGFIDMITIIGTAMVGGLFAMDAWAYVCLAAAEVKDPQRNLPRALLVGTGFVALLYLLVNISYMCVLPLFGDASSAEIVGRGIQFASEDRVATAVAQTMLGKSGLYFIAAAIMISTFGCVNGTILTGARMYYAMAKDGLFFKSVSKINPKTHVPTTALIVGGIWTCILTLSGNYSQILDYIIFATLIFYVLTIIGLFVLRKKRPDMERPYRAWGYPWLQILYIVPATIIAVILLIFKPVYTWPGFVIVLTGVPVYFLWNWRAKRS